MCDLTTLWGKKIAPFLFLQYFVTPHCILIIFGTQILKEICNKSAKNAVMEKHVIANVQNV